MSLITHQTPEQILQAATPEQKILWNSVFLRFGENLAINQIEESYQNWNLAPMFTFVARRIYLVYLFEYGGFNATTIETYINLWDETNNQKYTSYNTAGFYDTTAAARIYCNQKQTLINFWASRITAQNLISGRIIGYMINY